jgi:hypothetical protein
VSINLKAYVRGDALEIWHLFQDGGWVIRSGRDGRFVLSAIPIYGGEEQYISCYDNFVDAYNYAVSLT